MPVSHCTPDLMFEGKFASALWGTLPLSGAKVRAEERSGGLVEEGPGSEGPRYERYFTSSLSRFSLDSFSLPVHWVALV